MKQQVNITITITLWVDARKDRNGITTVTQQSLQRGFGDRLTSMHVIEVKEEAEIYGNDHPVPEPSLLPPDPDGMNFDRASWADRAISVFRGVPARTGRMPSATCWPT